MHLAGLNGMRETEYWYLLRFNKITTPGLVGNSSLYTLDNAANPPLKTEQPEITSNLNCFFYPWTSLTSRESSA